MEKKLLEFVNKRIKKAPNGCWEWTGSVNDKGYGLIYVEGKSKRAHRITYQLFKSEIPKGLFICHHCDNPGCVNPEHLFVGTQKDNMQDCIRKGRFVRPTKNGKPSNQNTNKTHCIRGHPFDKENTHIRPSGHRTCRACDRIFSSSEWKKARYLSATD